MTSCALLLVVGVQYIEFNFTYVGFNLRAGQVYKFPVDCALRTYLFFKFFLLQNNVCQLGPVVKFILKPSCLVYILFLLWDVGKSVWGF